jgi:hypothetical protein
MLQSTKNAQQLVDIGAIVHDSPVNAYMHVTSSVPRRRLQKCHGPEYSAEGCSGFKNMLQTAVVRDNFTF